MSTQTIASRLNDIAGFKLLFNGIFGGGKVKKSFGTYSESSKKGVYVLHKVRHAEHDDTKYVVYAFSPSGEIATDTLELLTERLANMSLGTIRYESLSYSYLEPWRGRAGSLAFENNEIACIMPEYPEVLIFPVADDVNCDYVIYAQKDGEHYVYPITDKQAKAIVGQA